MKVHPAGETIVVTEDAVKRSPLVLPNKGGESPLESRTYRVVAVGSGRVSDYGVHITCPFETGQLVAFRKQAKNAEQAVWNEKDAEGNNVQYVVVDWNKVAVVVEREEGEG